MFTCYLRLRLRLCLPFQLPLPLPLLFLFLLACAPAAFAQPAYALVFGPENSSPGAINRPGNIAGEANGRAFLWDGSTIVDLGSGSSSAAFGLSNNGLITGAADRPDGSSHAFLYDGSLRDIGQLGVSSSGAGVNRAGQVAGTYVDEAGENHAFLYSGGVMRDIGNLGANSARATGISERGEVVGSSFLEGFTSLQAFVYRASGNVSSIAALGTLGGPSSWANAINNNQQIAGASYIDDDILHAFLYEQGAMRDIGSLGGAITEARGLNDAGWVVGYSTYADDVPGIDFSSAFLYRDGAMFDLNLIVERPGVWSILDAYGINDAGQIAATACTEFGDCRAVRLDPIPAVPEPQPAALMLAGLLLGGMWKRLRRKP